VDLESEIDVIDEACSSSATSDIAKSLGEERLSLENCLKLVKCYAQNQRDEGSVELSGTVATEVTSMEGMPAIGHRNVQIAISTSMAKAAIENTALGSNNLQLGGHAAGYEQ
jgi:hypothetical protein